MRILYSTFTYPPERNGVALASSKEVSILRQLGHEVEVLTGSSGALPSPSIDNGSYRVRFSGNGTPWSWFRGDFEQLGAFTSKGSWDLAILAGWQNWATDVVLPQLRSTHPKLKVLIRSHGLSVNSRSAAFPLWVVRHLGWRPYLWFKVPATLASIHGLVALDDHDDTDRFLDVRLAKRKGIPVYSIPNVSPSFPESPSDSLPPARMPQPHFLSIGSYSQQKNEMVILRAYHASGLNHIPLVLVGQQQNAYSDRLQRMVARLGLKNVTLLFGPSEQAICELYRNAFAVLLGSRTECQPLALLDAMHFGIPFVATPVGSVPRMRGGILARDLCEMASGMRRLASDPHLHTHLSAEGKAYARMYHSESRIRDLWRTVLTTI